MTCLGGVYGLNPQTPAKRIYRACLQKTPTEAASCIGAWPKANEDISTRHSHWLAQDPGHPTVHSRGAPVEGEFHQQANVPRPGKPFDTMWVP
jgi:hypothetical protein